MLQQQRQPSPAGRGTACHQGRHASSLAAACTRSNSSNTARLLPNSTTAVEEAFGRDPVFQVGSVLFNPSLLGREPEFYNVSSELGPGGVPYMWRVTGSRGASQEATLLIDTKVGADRAKVLWQAVDDSGFLDRQTKTLHASIFIRNTALNIFGHVSARYDFSANGNIEVEIMPDGISGSFPIIPIALQAVAVVMFCVLVNKNAASGGWRIVSVMEKHVVYHLLGERPQSKEERLRQEKAAKRAGLWNAIKSQEAVDLALSMLVVLGLAIMVAGECTALLVRMEPSYEIYDAPQSSLARYGDGDRV